MKWEKRRKRTDPREEAPEPVIAEPEAPVPEAEDVSGAAYSLEEILSEFSDPWGRLGLDGEPEPAEEQEWEYEAEAETGGAEAEGTEVPDGAETALPVDDDADWTDWMEIRNEKNGVGEDAVEETGPDGAEEYSEEAETPADGADAAEWEETEEEDAQEEPEEETEPEPPARWGGYFRRRRKVWEEFPADPEQEPEPEPEEIDYSAMFHMYADEQQEETAAEPSADRGTTRSRRKAPETEESAPAEAQLTVEELDAIFGRLGLGGAEAAAESDAGADYTDYADDIEDDGTEESEEEAPAGKKDTPLFAEKSVDFRDILREFMLGDQHPIYADMPGIGKKAESLKTPEERAAEELEPKAEDRKEEEEEPDPNPRPRRTYTVEEDFPAEYTGFPETGKETPDQEGEAPAEEPAEESPEEPAAAEKPETGLRRLLHGFGSFAVPGKKRALNEPKAYARFEDYIEEKKPEEPAAEEAEKTAAAEDAAAETPEGQTAPAEPTEEEDEEILYSGDFPSFGQWILNELMTLWIRINGIGDRASTATMEDETEDLGREVNVANASRYYGSQVTMLRMRFEIGLVLLAILAYITLGLPVSGMLKTAKVASAMCLSLQLTIMLLCLDIVTNAAVNLARARFGADSLAVVFCLISSFDALVVAVGGFGEPHIPLCLFSSLSLMGVLYSSLLSARALRKSTRVPAIGKKAYCVTAEEGVRGGGDITLLKSIRPTAGFVRRAEETPPDENLFAKTAFLQLLAAVVLSLLTALIKHSLPDTLYILSAILSCAVPVTALLAFALPFFIGSQRIFSSGAAIAGWSGVHDIGSCRNLIVTDRDLFPEETLAIETVRIFADDTAERVIAYAGTMIAASGSGLAPCFAELMERNNCQMRNVEDFRWLAGGGLQGLIEGNTVLCGSADLMQLMNVKVPYRLVDKTTVLLAINGVLYGIFKINYTGLPAIRTALQELIASNRHPIFAIRDFNVTPELLHDVFDVATDGYDFPPFGDRFRISEAQPSESSKVAAVVCREGLGPLTHLADTGRSMYVAIRMNLLITAAVAAIGMLAVFFKLIGTGEVSAWLPFVLNVLAAIVVTLISLFMRF